MGRGSNLSSLRFKFVNLSEDELGVTRRAQQGSLEASLLLSAIQSDAKPQALLLQWAFQPYFNLIVFVGGLVSPAPTPAIRQAGPPRQAHRHLAPRLALLLVPLSLSLSSP